MGITFHSREQNFLKILFTLFLPENALQMYLVFPELPAQLVSVVSNASTAAAVPLSLPNLSPKTSTTEVTP